jgi:hypothetical protein
MVQLHVGRTQNPMVYVNSIYSRLRMPEYKAVTILMVRDDYRPYRIGTAHGENRRESNPIITE